ncbi:hypothetical protein ACWKWU_05835 [Chitinophaga lutea]
MFELYFQNGEFISEGGSIWIDLMINALGAFLGFLGAYFLYYYAENTTKKDTLKYAARLLTGIIDYCKNQASNCSTIAEEILATPWEMPLLKIEASSDLKRIAERIDQGKFFHSYLFKYGRSDEAYKNFAKIYGKIDFLDLTINDLKIVNEKIQNSLWERKKEYADTFTAVKMNMERIILDDRYIREPQFVHIPNRFNEILDSFYNANPKGQENIRETFVYVIWQLRLFIVSNQQKTPELTDILQLTMHAINQFDGITMAATKNAEDYKIYNNDINKATNELIAVTEALRKDFSS